MMTYQGAADELTSYGIHAKANEPHSFLGTQLQTHAGDFSSAEQAKSQAYAAFSAGDFSSAEQAKAQAYAAFSAGDFSSAVRHFSKATSVGPSNHLLYSNRSATYARLGKHFEALADAEKTVQLKPDWPKGYFRLGEAHFGLGHFDEAVAAYTKGLAVTTYTKGLACDPYDEGLRAGLAKVQSAISRSRAEPERKALAHKEMDFDTAIAHHTRAIELNDEDISFLLFRALTYLKMGQVWYGP